MGQPEPVAAGYTEADIAAAEAEFEAAVATGLGAMVGAAVAAVLAETVASAVTEATFGPAFTVWNRYVDDHLVPRLRRVFEESGEQLLESIQVTFGDVTYETTAMDPLDEPAEAWMAQATNRLRRVSNIVWEEIREQLVEGIAAGDGIKELADRIRRTAGFSEPRARTTARTEVAAAANGGSITQARALDLDMDKQWEATVPTDGRTRTTHIEAHHQTVPLGSPFIVGGTELDFPGDPAGQAEEVINCRCAITYLNIRARTETAAAQFEETKHKRDTRGRFAEKRGSAPGWDDLIKGALTRQDALDAAPVKLTPAPGGHSGNYEGANVTGPAGKGDPLALSEMEGLEHAVTNNTLRGRARLDLTRESDRARKETVDRRAAELDKTMAVSALPEPVIVHRGVKDGMSVFGQDAWYGDLTDEEFYDQGLRPDLTGLTWLEQGYSHTTVDQDRMAGYARKLAEQDPVAMRIFVPAGTPAVQLSGMDLEAELMLGRDLTFRVVADHGVDDAGVRQWDVEVVSK